MLLSTSHVLPSRWRSTWTLDRRLHSQTRVTRNNCQLPPRTSFLPDNTSLSNCPDSRARPIHIQLPIVLTRDPALPPTPPSSSQATQYVARLHYTPPIVHPDAYRYLLRGHEDRHLHQHPICHLHPRHTHRRQTVSHNSQPEPAPAQNICTKHDFRPGKPETTLQQHSLP